jgi:hypothetical protein
LDLHTPKTKRGRLKSNFEAVFILGGLCDFFIISTRLLAPLGELVAKSLHSVSGSAPQQVIDYRYNIRGWLTRINNSNLNTTTDGGPKDYFGMELSYNTSAGTGNAGVFNGNISAARWSLNQEGKTLFQDITTDI